MAKLTAEQRRVLREQEEEEARQAKIAFRASMPARLKKITELAKEVGVDYTISLTDSGVVVTINREKNPYMDYTLSYESDQWEVEDAESSLQYIRREIEARIERQALAKGAWEKLSYDEKNAVKEFIHSLF